MSVTRVEEPRQRSRICREHTRRFYEVRGFVPLEELHGVWDENNPCLLLVKHLPCR